MTKPNIDSLYGPHFEEGQNNLVEVQIRPPHKNYTKYEKSELETITRLLKSAIYLIYPNND